MSNKTINTVYSVSYAVSRTFIGVPNYKLTYHAKVSVQFLPVVLSQVCPVIMSLCCAHITGAVGASEMQYSVGVWCRNPTKRKNSALLLKHCQSNDPQIRNLHSRAVFPCPVTWRNYIALAAAAAAAGANAWQMNELPRDLRMISKLIVGHANKRTRNGVRDKNGQQLSKETEKLSSKP